MLQQPGAKKPRAVCALDFDQPGTQVGEIRVAHSDDEYVYGFGVPIAVIANGTGPTVLLISGNHGDEYEGQIAFRRIILEQDPHTIRGRLIIIPALNYPAMLAQKRVSPLDKGNMNRAFPGDPDGGPTSVLAHYVDSVLLPLCDAGLDLHSGGFASEFVPCAFVRKNGNDPLLDKKIELSRAFGAPWSIVVDGAGEDRSLLASADRRGVPMISTELGGGGTVELTALAFAFAGTNRVLQHLNVVGPPTESAPPTRFAFYRDTKSFVIAPARGIFEPYCRLGDEVKAGQPAGRLYPLDEPERQAVTINFATDGIVICRRVPAVAARGEYLLQLAREVSEAEVRR